MSRGQPAASNNLCFLANEKHFLAQLILANDWIAPGQFTPAGLAALIYRYHFDEINAARHLPAAQPRPAMREQFSLAQALRYHARCYFFIPTPRDRKSTRLNSSHDQISYAVFCLKKKKTK